VYFALSEFTVAIALLSPIDPISDDYLFTMHMVQHLAGVWPPLVLMAIPPWLSVRSSREPPWALCGVLTKPGVAHAVFVDLYVWHLPVLYDAALNNEQIHVVEHLCFMGTAVLNGGRA
jgi:putative membrane protein